MRFASSSFSDARRALSSSARFTSLCSAVISPFSQRGLLLGGTGLGRGFGGGLYSAGSGLGLGGCSLNGSGTVTLLTRGPFCPPPFPSNVCSSASVVIHALCFTSPILAKCTSSSYRAINSSASCRHDNSDASTLSTHGGSYIFSHWSLRRSSRTFSSNANLSSGSIFCSGLDANSRRN